MSDIFNIICYMSFLTNKSSFLTFFSSVLFPIFIINVYSIYNLTLYSISLIYFFQGWNRFYFNSSERKENKIFIILNMILISAHFGLGTFIIRNGGSVKHITNNPLIDLIYLNTIMSNGLVNNISQTELQGEVILDLFD